jgi:hypothetical protein
MAFLDEKNNLDSKLLKHFNDIEDEIEEILIPKILHSTLDNYIKTIINYLNFLYKLFIFLCQLLKVPYPDK